MNSIISLSSTPTSMSSREIAELTGKQHAHVLRDIRVMLEQIRGKQDHPNLDDIEIKGVSVERDDRGYVSVYHLDKTLTYTLIAGYRADIRFKIIQRWQELEAQQQHPAVPDDPLLLFARAVQQIEAQHRARLDAHDLQINLQGQKIDMLDRHVTTLVKVITSHRRPSMLNSNQIGLDLNPPAEPRVHDEASGRTHASPRQHYRQAHYRTLPSGRRVEVRAHSVGKKNKDGETIQ